MNKDLLEKLAKETRKSIIEMIHKAKSGHPGGSLSCVDIISYLYSEKMNINLDNIKDENRNRFVLSKGHASPALYSVLAEFGFFDKKELDSLRKINSLLQGHPDAKKIPGVDISTGSLGQGISNAVGMALGYKYDKKNSNIYVLLGDGELQEGIVWEAAMAAAHYKLDNLVAIIDNNGLQIDGKNEDVMGISPIDEKFRSFGWNVIKCDGHNFEELDKAFNSIKNHKPNVIIANTIKGKGVSFMENNPSWHGQATNESQRQRAIEDILEGSDS